MLKNLRFHPQIVEVSDIPFKLHKILVKDSQLVHKNDQRSLLFKLPDGIRSTKIYLLIETQFNFVILQENQIHLVFKLNQKIISADLSTVFPNHNMNNSPVNVRILHNKSILLYSNHHFVIFDKFLKLQLSEAFQKISVPTNSTRTNYYQYFHTNSDDEKIQSSNNNHFHRSHTLETIVPLQDNLKEHPKHNAESSTDRVQDHSSTTKENLKEHPQHNAENSTHRVQDHSKITKENLKPYLSHDKKDTPPPKEIQANGYNKFKYPKVIFIKEHNNQLFLSHKDKVSPFSYHTSTNQSIKYGTIDFIQNGADAFVSPLIYIKGNNLFFYESVYPLDGSVHRETINWGNTEDRRIKNVTISKKSANKTQKEASFESNKKNESEKSFVTEKGEKVVAHCGSNVRKSSKIQDNNLSNTDIYQTTKQIPQKSYIETGPVKIDMDTSVLNDERSNFTEYEILRTSTSFNSQKAISQSEELIDMLYFPDENIFYVITVTTLKIYHLLNNRLLLKQLIEYKNILSLDEKEILLQVENKEEIITVKMDLIWESAVVRSYKLLNNVDKSTIQKPQNKIKHKKYLKLINQPYLFLTDLAQLLPPPYHHLQLECLDVLITQNSIFYVKDSYVFLKGTVDQIIFESQIHCKSSNHPHLKNSREFNFGKKLKPRTSDCENMQLTGCNDSLTQNSIDRQKVSSVSTKTENLNCSYPHNSKKEVKLMNEEASKFILNRFLKFLNNQIFLVTTTLTHTYWENIENQKILKLEGYYTDGALVSDQSRFRIKNVSSSSTVSKKMILQYVIWSSDTLFTFPIPQDSLWFTPNQLTILQLESRKSFLTQQKNTLFLNEQVLLLDILEYVCHKMEKQNNRWILAVKSKNEMSFYILEGKSLRPAPYNIKSEQSSESEQISSFKSINMHSKLTENERISVINSKSPKLHQIFEISLLYALPLHTPTQLCSFNDHSLLVSTYNSFESIFLPNLIELSLIGENASQIDRIFEVLTFFMSKNKIIPGLNPNRSFLIDILNMFADEVDLFALTHSNLPPGTPNTTSKNTQICWLLSLLSKLSPVNINQLNPFFLLPQTFDNFTLIYSKILQLNEPDQFGQLICTENCNNHFLQLLSQQIRHVANDSGESIQNKIKELEIKQIETKNNDIRVDPCSENNINRNEELRGPMTLVQMELCPITRFIINHLLLCYFIQTPVLTDRIRMLNKMGRHLEALQFCIKLDRGSLHDKHHEDLEIKLCDNNSIHEDHQPLSSKIETKKPTTSNLDPINLKKESRDRNNISGRISPVKTTDNTNECLLVQEELLFFTLADQKRTISPHFQIRTILATFHPVLIRSSLKHLGSKVQPDYSNLEFWIYDYSKMYEQAVHVLYKEFITLKIHKQAISKIQFTDQEIYEHSISLEQSTCQNPSTEQKVNDQGLLIDSSQCFTNYNMPNRTETSNSDHVAQRTNSQFHDVQSAHDSDKISGQNAVKHEHKMTQKSTPRISNELLLLTNKINNYIKRHNLILFALRSPPFYLFILQNLSIEERFEVLQFYDLQSRDPSDLMQRESPESTQCFLSVDIQRPAITNVTSHNTSVISTNLIAPLTYELSPNIIWPLNRNFTPTEETELLFYGLYWNDTIEHESFLMDSQNYSHLYPSTHRFSVYKIDNKPHFISPRIFKHLSDLLLYSVYLLPYLAGKTVLEMKYGKKIKRNLRQYLMRHVNLDKNLNESTKNHSHLSKNCTSISVILGKSHLSSPAHLYNNVSKSYRDLECDSSVKVKKGVSQNHVATPGGSKFLEVQQNNLNDQIHIKTQKDHLHNNMETSFQGASQNILEEFKISPNKTHSSFKTRNAPLTSHRLQLLIAEMARLIEDPNKYDILKKRIKTDLMSESAYYNNQYEKLVKLHDKLCRLAEHDLMDDMSTNSVISRQKGVKGIRMKSQGEKREMGILWAILINLLSLDKQIFNREYSNSEIFKKIIEGSDNSSIANSQIAKINDQNIIEKTQNHTLNINDHKKMYKSRKNLNSFHNNDSENNRPLFNGDQNSNRALPSYFSESLAKIFAAVRTSSLSQADSDDPQSCSFIIISDILQHLHKWSNLRTISPTNNKLSTEFEALLTDWFISEQIFRSMRKKLDRKIKQIESEFDC